MSQVPAMSASSPLPATAQQQAADAGTRVTSGPPAGITWTVVAVLALLSAVMALVVVDRVYPYGTRNRDDQAYIAQARLLEDGRLTISRSEATFFRPVLMAFRGDKLMYLYTPAWPAVLAASDAIFGSMRAALAISAALTVVALALLAGELWSDRRVVLAATVIFVFSPFFMSQSGTFLSYQFSLLLFLLSGWLLLRGLRTRGRWTLVAAGAAIGAALFARPFDSLLVAVPFGAYVVCTRRRDLRSLLRPTGWVMVGVLPLLVLTAALNQHLMGSATSFPQNVAGSLNKFGFGDRLGIHDAQVRNFTPIHFTLAKSWDALSNNMQLLPRWMFGSYLGVAFALFAVVRRRRDPRIWLLLSLVAVFPLGYLFWWGNYSATFLHHLTRGLGPFYYYPTIVPLALLAGAGVVAFGSWLATIGTRSVVAGASMLMLVAVALTGVEVRAGLHDATNARSAERAALAPTRPVPRNSLLFLQQSELGNPLPELVNQPDLRNSPLYATDHLDRNMELIDRYPGKELYALRRIWDADADVFTVGPRPTLMHLTRRSFATITETLTFTNPGPKPYVIAYAQEGGRIEARVLDTASSRNGHYTVRWTVAAPGSRVGSANTFTLSPAPAGAYTLGFATSNTSQLTGADRYELTWSFGAPVWGPARLVEPPAPFKLLQFSDGRSAYVEEQVEPVLARDAAPLVASVP